MESYPTGLQAQRLPKGPSTLHKSLLTIRIAPFSFAGIACGWKARHRDRRAGGGSPRRRNDWPGQPSATVGREGLIRRG